MSEEKLSELEALSYYELSANYLMDSMKNLSTGLMLLKHTADLGFKFPKEINKLLEDIKDIAETAICIGSGDPQKVQDVLEKKAEGLFKLVGEMPDKENLN